MGLNQVLSHTERRSAGPRSPCQPARGMVPTPAWGVKPHIAGPDRAISGKSTILRRSDISTAVTPLLIARCVVLALLAMGLAVALVRGLRGSERQAEARVSTVVETLERRMD